MTIDAASFAGIGLCLALALNSEAPFHTTLCHGADPIRHNLLSVAATAVLYPVLCSL
ncbi:hypothetical protein ABH994_005269 [Bradyrhizobium yuanmingense]|uniref:Uncharacterized protein n=1 Tax=Bradyrhizobium yuanmingense TaxID=108015 RepID=A0ABV4GN23_9BRAD|nr:hypothetical protein [Bradyrhizobium yuanmingense]